MSTAELDKIEREIDEAFADNELKKAGFAQGVWTILSVAEDLHFKILVMDPLSDSEAAIYVDGLLNALTYPLRVLHREAYKTPALLDRRYIDEHYALASHWIDAAEDYTHFCSVFPLFHANEIEIKIVGNFLEPSDWTSTDLSYEVYDRFTAKRDPKHERRLNSDSIAQLLQQCIRSSGGAYSVEFNRRLLNQLHEHFGAALLDRHLLPANWQFSSFSLAQYRAVFVCLQVMAQAWFAARELVASNGVPGIAYQSSVWTPRKGVLLTTISRYTRLPTERVRDVLRYLTFGEVGVRNPDIAIQPLVDLGNDHFAVSPFVMSHVHAERNLCVLLNQVPADRKIYAQLVDEKEGQLRAEAIEALQARGYDCRYGKVDQTDIDLAVIDHVSKVCLCVELKWFIEPAEIREVLMRSEELAKGVSQAKIINGLFVNKDKKLLQLLGIDNTYDLLAMVGSVNFIGRRGIQEDAVPITKVWHLMANIAELGTLGHTLEWLRSRSYLPVKDRDFKIKEVPIECGRWKSKWYGIGRLNQDEENRAE